MACRIGPTILQPCLSAMETECPERPCLALATNCPEFGAVTKALEFEAKAVGFPDKRHGWKIAFALDTGGIPSNGGQESLNGNGPDLGRTRLGRIVSAGGRQLLEKLNSARKNFPMKIFLLLLGFYTANALATILGQTGDWDVLVAGVVVAAIEGIGMLMYRKPSSLSTGRLQSFIGMINYWKAGVCLGLFVDAFKLGS
uniref:Ycf20-like protein n=1 Tax=Fagus sylvatica TaxID=28930 RepID=A0A2N9IBW3_FAGSY